MTKNSPDLMKTTNFPTKSEDKQKINSLKNVTVKLLKTKNKGENILKLVREK